MRRWLVLGTLLLLPTTTAFDVAVEPVGDPIRPDVEMRDVEMTVTMTCEEAFAVAAPGAGHVEVNLEAIMPPGASSAGPSMVVVPTSPCYGPGALATTSETATFSMGVTRELQGLVPHPASIDAVVTSQNPGQGDGLTASGQFQFVADYWGHTSASVAEPIVQVEPGEAAQFEIELINLGNAKTTYTFELSNGITGFSLPDPIHLDSRFEGDNRATAIIRFVTPAAQGWNNEQIAIPVEIHSAAFDDSERIGDEITANLLARSRGYTTDGDEVAAVPGPGIPLLVLAAAAVAMARRRT